MVALLFWASVVAAVFDWRFMKRGGVKPTRSEYGLLVVALALCAGVAILFGVAGARSEGVGRMTALLVTVVFVMWEISRFRTRRTAITDGRAANQQGAQGIDGLVDRTMSMTAATPPTLPEGARPRRIYFAGGLQRLFVVVWVLYAVAVFLSPFFMVASDREAAWDLAGRQYNACLAAAREMPIGTAQDDERHQKKLDDCRDAADRGMALATETHRPTAYYRAFGWHGLWVFPLALVFPPAMLYGFARGVGKTANWVIAGFRA